MKRTTARKAERHGGRRGRGREDQPLELARGWNELEAQHERLRSDMMSLAAMLGPIARPRY